MEHLGVVQPQLWEDVHAEQVRALGKPAETGERQHAARQQKSVTLMRT